MIFIRHRVNSSSALRTVEKHHGVEIDLRSNLGATDEIHLSHDPWKRGEPFETWLKEFSRLAIEGPLILNTKEDGLEERAVSLLERYALENYFFLDTALPTLVRHTTRLGKSTFAVRVSQFEPAEAALKFSGLAKYLWLDCFGGEPVSVDIAQALAASFEICLVSPELHTGEISGLQAFRPLARHAQMICTKDPRAWAEILKG